MKHYALLLALLAFVGLKSMNAEDRAENTGLFSVSVETFGGVFFGSMTEEVYAGEALLSRIIWEEQIAPYIGLDLKFGAGRFFIQGRLLSTIPVESGKVKDTDWLDLDDEKDLYSEHRSFLDKHFQMTGLISYAQPLGSVTLALAAGMVYRNRKWAAQDGFLQYAGIEEEWSESTPKEQVKGTVMTYESAMWFPLIELDASYALSNRLTVGLIADFYPYLSITTIDSHYLKGERYVDEMRGGMGLQITGNIIYTPRFFTGLSFSAGVIWERIFPSRGQTAVADIGVSGPLTIENGYYAGTESSLWHVELGMIVRPLELLR
jgi:outer membrane protease